jgi:hypothetical protein
MGLLEIFNATGLREMFRGPPPICERQELAQFIDEQSAFIVQKGIYEYSRARAGHYAKVLFKELQFHEAIERSRWRAYPLGLAMVGELVEGVLRPLVGDDDRGRQLEDLRSLVLSVFDRYPTPAVLGEAEWKDLRVELERRLQLIGLHPVKRAFAVAEPFAKAYFDLMPIHRQLRASEFPTLHGYLKVTLCNIHDALTRRLDADALIKSLRTSTG